MPRRVGLSATGQLPLIDCASIAAFARDVRGRQNRPKDLKTDGYRSASKTSACTADSVPDDVATRLSVGATVCKHAFVSRETQEPIALIVAESRAIGAA